MIAFKVRVVHYRYNQRSQVKRCSFYFEGKSSLLTVLLPLGKQFAGDRRHIKSMSSMQTTGNSSNLLATKAITRRFVVQHCIPICSQFHASNSCQPTYSNQLANQLQNTHFSLVTSVSQGGHWLVCRSAWTRLLESVSQWLPETSIKHSQPVEEYTLGQSFMSQMEPNVPQWYWY